jgi:hypothetical protein
MAWIQQKKRSDGGTSAAVRWRLGGARSGPMQTETFSAGSDDQNLARAEGFRRMVEAGGHEWPDGWVKGMGFVRPREDADPMREPGLADKVTEAIEALVAEATASRFTADHVRPLQHPVRRISRHASPGYSPSSSSSSTRATWRPAPTPIPYVTT